MPEPADPVQKQLAKLRKRYAAELPRKVARVEEQIESLQASAWEEEAWVAACRQLHSLAGSAGTYGFVELGTAARAGERLIQASLEARRALGSQARKELAAILSTMKELAAGAAG